MPYKNKQSDNSRTSAQIEHLASLSRDALAAHWQSLYSKQPPFKMSRQLLYQAVAYRLQEQAVVGLKPATRRYLEQAVASTAAGKALTSAALASPGTRLLREWHGVTYEVIVIDDGVLFKGQRYQSLSEVARVITGVRWSGPLFFGLKNRSAVKGDAT